MSKLYVNEVYPQSGDWIAVSGNLDVSGTLTAYQFNTIVQSETTYLGSNSFGNDSTDVHFFTGSVYLQDDSKLTFGTGNDASIEYDENGTDELIITLPAGGGDIALPNNDAAALEIKEAGNAYMTFDTSTDDESIISAKLHAFSAGIIMEDDVAIYFGSDDGGDASIEYDENGTDELRFAGAAATFEQAVTFDANVTLGNANSDIVTSTGQLTASQGLTSTDAAFFNANVTLGNAAADVTTVTSQLTASQGAFMARTVAGKLRFGADEEYIYGDGTDIHIGVGANGDINIPIDIGLTFGDDGEKVEGDGTDLYVASSNDIHMMAATDINIPADVGLTFGNDGEKIEGDGTDLIIASSNDLTLNAGGDIILDSAVTINETGADKDFRVESNGNANMLFVDGGNNKVGIGTIVPVSILDVAGSSGGILTLSTSDTTVVATNVLGQINFQAPLEASATDAILVGASIKAVAAATFAADSNASTLIFSTGESETAVERMRIMPKGSVTTQVDFGTDATAFTDDYGTDGNMEGEIIKLLNTTVVKSKMYFLDYNSGTPQWTLAQADSSPVGEEFLLALAVNTNSNTHGMLLRGMARIASDAYDGTAVIGSPLYMSDGTAGEMDFAAPDGSGEIVRIVGYCLKEDSNNDILVYFNPSNDYVEIA